MTQEKLDLWGIVELFGHNRIAGRLTEQNVAGTNMLRVDVPETETNPAFTRLFGSAAIYAINPTTEEVAKMYASKLESKPIDSWDIRQFSEKLMLKMANRDEMAATGMDEDLIDEDN